MALLLTIIPSFLILLYIIRSDKFPEPTKLIITTFILGFLLCLPAGILNTILIWNRENAEAFTFLAGITEESLKFLALLYFIKDRVEFNEPLDAIVYGTLISLGFATFENFEYVFLYNEGYPPIQIAAIRAVTAIPLHAMCGILMGYFFGFYVFRGDSGLFYKALFFPMFIHCLYNFSLNIYFGLTFIILIGTFLYARKIHNELFSLQKNKNEETEVKLK